MGFAVALVTVVWALALYAVARTAWSLRSIARLDAPAPPAWPTVSLVVAAKDEAEGIDAALRSRLADDYPALEVVAVDDRSEDATGAILDAIAAEDPRLRAIHVTSLPDGWLGKLHAMKRGEEAAAGEWILFSDADVHFAPGTLRKVIAHAVATGLDHVTVVPHFTATGYALDACIDVFLRNLTICGRLWAVPDPASSAAAGGGLFNLVRRSALARTPGLEWIRLEIADDMGLAQMIKKHGGRSEVLHARGHVSLAFYDTLAGLARGVEKSALPVIGRFSHAALHAQFVPYIALEVFTVAAPFVAPRGWPATLSLVALCLMLATTALTQAWAGRSLRTLPAAPFAAVLTAVFMLRSSWSAARRGGIVWRGTTYDLDTLKAGARYSPW
ncbi:MAG: glycosyltransferase [Polyangiales bacterium]